MIERNEQFTHYGFPVDVLWTDLYYTQDMEYFVFNRDTWPIWQVQMLEAELENSKRRFVTINDPHISTNSTYFVYEQGMALQNGAQTSGNITNVFVNLPDGKTPFVGACWPGPAQWIDYLNTNAADFWGSLYLRSNFLGSNYLFGTWNDMNEPSVFLNETDWTQVGMPMNNTHVMTDGTVV